MDIKRTAQEHPIATAFVVSIATIYGLKALSSWRASRGE